MKTTKKLFLFMALVLGMFSCTDLDEVNERLDNLETKVKQLEALIDAANLDIQANKALIDVQAERKSVLSYEPLADGSGYELTMSDNSKIVLKNGQDGKSQIAGVKKDADGKLYWTINGEFMMVDGRKVLAQGADGQPGATPMMTVDKDGFWQVSTDGGKTWTNVKDPNGSNVKAKGEDGKPGKDAATDLSITESEDGKTITITFNGQTYILPISGSEEVMGPKLPLEYVAEYNIAPDGVSFVTTHGNDVSGYFTYDEAMAKFAADKNFMIDGKGYHLPSIEEWEAIVPGKENTLFFVDRYFDPGQVRRDIEETVTIAGETKTYKADYKSMSEKNDVEKVQVDYNGKQGHGVGYALRFKDETNELLSAWRYEYKDNSVDLLPTSPHGTLKNPKVMVITARLLGPDFKGTVEDICKPEFWSSNNEKDVMRIFPAALNNNPLERELGDDDDWGWKRGYYLSSSAKQWNGQNTSSYGMQFFFSWGGSVFADNKANTLGIKNNYPVRLFSNE